MNVNHLSGLLGRLWLHIEKRRRRQFYGVGILMLVSAVSEVFSLGAVIPFLMVLATPELIEHYALLRWVEDLVGVAHLALFFTSAFVVAALIAGLLRILLLWSITRVSSNIGAELSVELYRRTLYQRYEVHSKRNSSAVLSGVGKVGGAMSILSQCMMLASSLVLFVTITATLVAIDPQVAVTSIVVFGMGYWLIAVITRRRLRQYSQRIADEQTRVFKALQEGLGGIRDVLLGGMQKLYCDVYESADKPLRRDQGNVIFIAGSPRFVMEALGLVTIAILAYFLSTRAAGLSGAIPSLGALALGAQRLLPVLQNGYSAWATVVGNQASLADTIELLDQPIEDEWLTPSPLPLEFSRSIDFAGISFRYNEDGPWIVRNMNLVIRKGSRVGFVGATGSGKSTTIDILMGLLAPTEGKVLVDGESVDGERLRAWQGTIAHVPQSIYLSDASFAENIALGVTPEQIDHERVKLAARQAQIADFIESTPLGYQTSVGERGTRLSGGQRQRVGIARALYKQASVLIFDEATSALDNVTENSLMESIDALNRDLTILLIAHRLTTVRLCDVVVELQDGVISAQGDYQSLLRNSESFRRLAGDVV